MRLGKRTKRYSVRYGSSSHLFGSDRIGSDRDEGGCSSSYCILHTAHTPIASSPRLHTYTPPPPLSQISNLNPSLRSILHTIPNKHPNSNPNPALRPTPYHKFHPAPHTKRPTKYPTYVHIYQPAPSARTGKDQEPRGGGGKRTCSCFHRGM